MNTSPASLPVNPSVNPPVTPPEAVRGPRRTHALLILLALSATACATRDGYPSPPPPPRPALSLYLPYSTFRAAVQNQTPLCVGKSTGSADACGGQPTPPNAVPPVPVTDLRVRWVVCGIGDGVNVRDLPCVSIIEEDTTR